MNQTLHDSLRILVLTPTGNDALNATLVLQEAGLEPEICLELPDACAKISEGAGALLIAEEAFTPEGTQCLIQSLAGQPPWSDIPVVLVTSGENVARDVQSALKIVAPAGNVTLLERPLRPSTLVSSLQVALRARKRQYQLRDLLEQQQVVLASIYEAFVTIDRNWRYTYVSDRAAEIAHRSRDEMLGKNYWELNPDVANTLKAGLHRAMLERVPVTVEYYHPTLDLWFESRAFPAPSGISVFTRDVTQRKFAERALQDSRDELEKRVEERTARLKETISELEAFSYSVSHDLRTPLRAMQGYSEFLWEDYSAQLDDKGKEYVRRILQASARLDRLVQDILTYSRVTRAELEIKDIRVENLLAQVIESYPMLRSSNIVIEPELPLLPVRGHEGSLTQVFSNLLTNALKFVPEDRKPRVKIRTE